MSIKNDTRSIMSSGSVIQLLPYNPKPFNTDDRYRYARLSKEPDVFTIIKTEGVGSSCICYKAEKHIGENLPPVKGILKEFYPLDQNEVSKDKNGFAINIHRVSFAEDETENQIYADYGTFNNFMLLKKAYESSFAIINEKRNDKNSFSADLNKYIPKYSYYSGIPSHPQNNVFCSKDISKNVSFYVWVENETGLYRFSDYLSSLCEKMQSEYDLYGRVENRIVDLEYILKCILELSKCIDILHCFALRHLDISPNNFGVELYNSEVDRDSPRISLYDTNSLKNERVSNQIIVSKGTPYFRCPEIKKGEKCSIQSDIYSIGTLLYYALVIKSKDGKFCNVYYCEDFEKDSVNENEVLKAAFDNIHIDLTRSELLQSSDDTKNSIILEKLSKIIKKALNRFEDSCGTYRTAGDIADDISNLLNETGLEKWKAAHPELSATIKLESNEDRYDRDYGATGAIEKLLFAKPLYDYCFGTELNLLVVGCGTYSSEFIDFALEFSQGMNFKTNITVLTDDCDAKKSTYLSARPAFTDFFEVDGTPPLNDSSKSYGSLEFLNINFKDKREETVKDALSTVLNGSEFSYIFIALNDDKLNRSVASACFDLVVDKEHSLISYVQYNHSKIILNHSCFEPVYVNDTLNKSPEYNYLKRMAFNIHLLWSGVGDIESAAKSFKKRYNFNSSMESAISVKYKLHSIGKELDIDHPEIVARKFAEELNNKDSSKIKSLVHAEHARWNVEKITDGLTALDDISVLKTSTKTDSKHPCLVPSTEEWALESAYWAEDNKKNWDNPSADISKLDKLDRLSIDLHRHWKDEINNLRLENGVRLSSELDSLLLLASGHFKLNTLIKSLSDTASQLLYNDDNNLELVKKFKKLFAQINHIAYKENLEEIIDKLDKIKSIMVPLLEYRSFTDWKSKDKDIVFNIPFILTYSSDLHLCIPFKIIKSNEGNRNPSVAFSNVATALVVNPKAITYIADGDCLSADLSSFIDSLVFSLSFIEKHGLQTCVYLKILVNREKSINSEIINSIFSISDLIKSVDVLPYIENEQVKTIHRFLINEKGRGFSAIELDNSIIGQYITTAMCSIIDNSDGTASSQIPTYRFDFISGKFVELNYCELLGYINNHPVLFSDDIDVFTDGKSKEIKPEEMLWYQQLWEVYTGECPELENYRQSDCVNTWNYLCEIISKYVNAQHSIELLNPTNKSPKSSFRCYSTVILDFAKPFIDRLLNLLKNSNKAFLLDYMWKSFSSGASLLEVYAPSSELTDALNNLLTNPLSLYQNDSIDITRSTSGFKICFKPLIVTDLSFPQDRRDLCIGILKVLEQRNMIRSLAVHSNNNNISESVSFAFSTYDVLDLFLNKETIVEYNTYYELLRSGYFDDVVIMSLPLINNNTGFNNQYIVITRGLQTMFVKCISQTDLSKDYIQAVRDTSNSFGINSIPIVLVYDQENDNNNVEDYSRYDMKVLYSSANIEEKLNHLFSFKK